jgi:hypothetical protein
MRIVVAIAHYFKPKADGIYGSQQEANALKRARGLGQAIASLHAVYGGGGIHQETGPGTPVPADRGAAHQVMVIICTTKGRHLVDELAVPGSHYLHCETDSEPMLLGFECQRVLRDRLPEKFDFYCYLEDDIIVRDPMFFEKQSWFQAALGSGCILQPNRFEIVARRDFQKLYLDGEHRPAMSPEVIPLIPPRDEPEVELQFLGRPVSFQRPMNPHSGAYFLSHEQMTHWAGQPHFLDRDCGFTGPLESAATLGVLKTFKIYKPSLASANFLEIEHYAPDHSQRVGTAFTLLGAEFPRRSPLRRLAGKVSRWIFSR